MSIGSLFSGIGGLEIALERIGFGPVIWQAESDPYARAVLAKNWPGVHCYEDVRNIDETAQVPTIICGGFPCQDLSIAGRQAGIGAERSGLWWEFRRIVRKLRPQYVAIENVAHSWRKWLPVVRRSLWKVGYASLPIRVSAAEAGAWHERARVFVLAYSTSNGRRSGRARRFDSGNSREQQQAFQNATTPDADRELLRDMRGRRCWEDGQGAGVASDDGSQRTASYLNRERELQPEGGIEEKRGRVGHSGRWSTEPDVARVVHGIPFAVDRTRCLGNSCVPDQAEAAFKDLFERIVP